MTDHRTSADAKGRVLNVFLAQAPNSPMKQVPEAMAIQGHGLEGCRHGKKRKDTKRQVLLLDVASLHAFDLTPGRLKENVLIEGLPLESYPPGQRLRIGDAVIEITEQCVPCHKMERIRPGLLSAIWGHRGQLAKVIEGGLIREGAEVVVLDVNPDAPKPIRPRLP